MTFTDRVLTIVVTATLTSLLWIVFGGTLLDMAQDRQADDDPAAAVAEPASPAPVQIEPTPSGDVTGESAASATATSQDDGLRIPVDGVAAAQLKDTFLEARDDEGVRRHEAIDIMASRGTPVVAASAGTIAKLHSSPAGGNAIYLRTPDRKHIHFYAHLDSYASGLREGQPVRAGQRLGTVGSTGNAPDDAPHLHFAILETTADAEWWEPANAVNPFPLLRGQGS